MKTTRLAIAFSIVALSLPAVSTAHEESALEKSLKQVLTSHLKAYDDESVEGTLRDVHTKSPEYDKTKQEIGAQFAGQDLRLELVGFRLFGHDDEFAVARTKTKFTGAPGSGFRDNVLDSITVFHQENGAWKLWSDDVLGVEFLTK